MTPRDKRLLVVSVLFGPLVGMVLFMLASAIGSGRQYGWSEGWASAALLISVLPLAVIGAYVLGAVPGLIGGLAMALLWRWFPRHRLWLAAPVGAASTLPTTLVMIRSLTVHHVPTAVIMAIIGAISALVCVALADRRSAKDSLGTQN